MRNGFFAAVAHVVLLGAVLTMVACSRPDTVRTVFTIDGMHCDACSSAITTSLEKTDGVIEASADHEQGTAEVVYHSRVVEVETLEDEIENLGYTVTGTTTSPVGAG